MISREPERDEWAEDDRGSPKSTNSRYYPRLRRLVDDPVTLEDLAAEFGVSRERVRQIEVRAFEKVQKAVKHRVAAMEGSPAQIAHQPRPYARDQRQQRTIGSTTRLRASLSDVSSLTAAA